MFAAEKIKGRHEKKYFKIISLNEAEKYAGMSEFSLSTPKAYVCNSPQKLEL